MSEHISTQAEFNPIGRFFTVATVDNESGMRSMSVSVFDASKEGLLQAIKSVEFGAISRNKVYRHDVFDAGLFLPIDSQVPVLGTAPEETKFMYIQDVDELRQVIQEFAECYDDVSPDAVVNFAMEQLDLPGPEPSTGMYL